MTPTPDHARDLASVLAGTVANLREDRSINDEAKKTLDLTATFLAQEIAAALREARAEGLEEAAKVVLSFGSKSSNPSDPYAPWMASPVYKECNEMASQLRQHAATVRGERT